MPFHITIQNDSTGSSISIGLTDAQIAALVATQAPTTTTPPPVVAVPKNASGIALPTGNLPGWKQILAEDFPHDCALGSFLSTYPGWWTYQELIKDTSKNGVRSVANVVSASGSCLDMFLRTEGGVCYGSCPCPPGPAGKGQLYGRYSACFRVVGNLPGYKTAWLLWPVSEAWPRDGEIDFPEGDLTGTIDAFMHRQSGTSGTDMDAYRTKAMYGAGWHVATIEWTPSAVVFILDGTVIGKSTNRIPNTPMRWVLQTETSTSGVAPAAGVSGHIQVDWVAAYSYQP